MLCARPVEEGGFWDSCGECESCRLLEAGTHPDFNHVYKELREFTEDGKDKGPPVDMPVDVIREFLIDKVSSRPTLSARKVFVVSEAERLNPSSQNALLKVLEEPPGYCTIILLCTRLEKLLPTVKSRCQIIQFGPIDKVRIVGKLEEMGLEGEVTRYLAGLAGGSLGAACQWGRLELEGAGVYAAKKDVVESLSGYGLADSLELAEKLLRYGKDIGAAWTNMEADTSKTDLNRRGLKTVVRVVICALHDAMKLNIGAGEEMVNSDQRRQVEKLAQAYDAEALAQAIGDCYRSLAWIDASVNEKLIFEHLLLQIADYGRIQV